MQGRPTARFSSISLSSSPVALPRPRLLRLQLRRHGALIRQQVQLGRPRPPRPPRLEEHTVGGGLHRRQLDALPLQRGANRLKSLAVPAPGGQGGALGQWAMPGWAAMRCWAAVLRGGPGMRAWQAACPCAAAQRQSVAV